MYVNFTLHKRTEFLYGREGFCSRAGIFPDLVQNPSLIPEIKLQIYNGSIKIILPEWDLAGYTR
jgi:hypothetical protein